MKRYIFLVLIVTLLLGCEIKSPNGTKWEIDLNLPLMDEVYPIIDLVDDEYVFMDEADSTLYVETKGEINSREIDELKVELNSEFTLNSLNSDTPSYPGSIPFLSILPDYTIEVVAGKILSGDLVVVMNDIVTEVHDGTVTIVFNEVYDENGENFSPSIDINQFGSQEHRFELNNHVIKSSDDIMSGNTVNELTFTINIQDNMGSAESINYGSIDIRLSDMVYFESFLGNITGYYLDIEEDLANVDIEYPQNIDDVVVIEDARVELDLISDIGFETTFDGYITSYNDDGDSIRIEILDDNDNNFSIPSAEVLIDSGYPTTSPVTNQFVSDKQIDQLFSIMPTSLVIHSSRVYVQNPVNSYGFIALNHSVYGDYTGIIPFNFSLNDSSVPLITDDSSTALISKENQDIIEEHCQRAEIELAIENKLPIGGRIQIFIHNEPLGGTVDSLNLAMLQLKGESSEDEEEPVGYYVSSLSENTAFNIPIENFEVFLNDEVYIKFLMYADVTDEPILISGTVNDYIRISGALKLTVLMQQLGEAE